MEQNAEQLGTKGSKTPTLRNTREGWAPAKSKSGAGRRVWNAKFRAPDTPGRMVEAGGVEPPSEKPCHSKTTCLSRSDGFTGRAQSGQDALPASPMILPAHYGPKRDGQPTV